MTITPRWYQSDLIEKTRKAWTSGHQNVLVVSPPRSGKTLMAVWLSEPFIARGESVFMQAHRAELVKQIAMEFAEQGHTVNVLAPNEVVSAVVHQMTRDLGRNMVDANALVTIGSVQTTLARAQRLPSWAARVKLWITDEAHHCLTGNQWGKVIELFPNAYGAGFTATPARTDRKSLARSQGGVFDEMVKGVTARQLIDEGHICDYRIIAPPSSIDRTAIKIGSTGDFTQKGLHDAEKHSTITGDAVASYLAHTPNEQAIVFAVDVDHATRMAQAYRDAGISADVVSAKTPPTTRKHLMDKFQRGVFQVLVNVDLFGEGLNVKGITCVIMARPTQSFVLYVQQFFRALTKADGKARGTIIDHAGNVGFFGKLYGLPDTYNRWTLESEERGKRKERDPDVIPIKVCLNETCFQPYLGTLSECPYCGFAPEPASRKSPEHVEGDLVELDAETLAALRGEIERVDGDPVYPNTSDPAILGAVKKNHRLRQEAQTDLREAMARWSHGFHVAGESDREIQKRFFFKFGVDMATAQTLKTRDARDLLERITR